MDEPSIMINNGVPCPQCGQWTTPNMPHFCQWLIPVYPAPQPPPAALTLEDIRKIVREEIERRFPPQTPDSASRNQEQT